jgi:hypothetical protein
MAKAAKKALEMDSFKVVADAGYSNGEQVAHCEAAGMVPYVPVMRTVNNQGNCTLFDRADFRYEPDSDTYVCPGDERQWAVRCTSRNRHRDNGLQPQAHHQRALRSQTDEGTSSRLLERDDGNTI